MNRGGPFLAGSEVVIANPRSKFQGLTGKVINPFMGNCEVDTGAKIIDKMFYELEYARDISNGDAFSGTLKRGDRVRVISDCMSFRENGTVKRHWNSPTDDTVDVTMDSNGKIITFSRKSLAKLSGYQSVEKNDPTTTDTPVIVLYEDNVYEVFENEQAALDEIQDCEEEGRVLNIVDAKNPRVVVRERVTTKPGDFEQLFSG